MWELIRANKQKSLFLFFIMGMCLLILGLFIGGAYGGEDGTFFGLLVAAGIWIFMSIISYFSGDSIILMMSKAKKVSYNVHPQLFNVVEEMKIAANLPAMPDIYIIPEEAPNVYKTIGEDYVYKVIRPLLRTAIRDIAVKYTAEDIYSTKRDEFVDRMMEHATKLAEGKGVEIDRVLLRNVKLPSEIEKAINEKLAADQEAQRMNFVLEKEKLEKERKIIEAEGIREANRIIAQGLTANYLRWYRIEMMKQLINSPNNTIMVIPEDLKSLPMIMPTGK